MGRPKNYNREQLLKKAATVFWKKGYSDTSVQDLEKITGVNKSGLYSEFKNKQALFVACLDHFLSSGGASCALSRQPLGWLNIEDFLRSSQTCHTPKGCFAVNTMREFAIIPDKAKKLLCENNAKIKNSIIQNLIAEGVSHSGTLADIIMAFNTGVSLMQNGQENLSANEQLEYFLRLVKRPEGLSAHSASW